jgi:hypothetical protein
MERIAVVFKNEEIRRTLHNNEWWFSVDDIVESLTNSSNCIDYIKEICKHDQELSRDWGKIVIPLWIGAPGGKQKVNCASTEGIFRIIQSIPLPNGESYKRWLAKVGSERVQEILDPELATKRTKAIYRAKGYSEAWIEKRMRGIAVQAELTDEWKNRGVNGEPEYAILTTEIARRQDAQGFGENKTAARKGGRIAGEAREKLEVETDNKVASSENYLTEPESCKRLRGKK